MLGTLRPQWNPVEIHSEPNAAVVGDQPLLTDETAAGTSGERLRAA